MRWPYASGFPDRLVLERRRGRTCGLGRRSTTQAVSACAKGARPENALHD